MRSSRGQATIEYVGAVLLVAAILIIAAVVVAAPGVPRTVVAKLRLGLCIVGGDVCTTSDAAARGLEPCLLSSDERDETGGVSFLTFRVGATDTWVAERRSDGSILLHSAAGSQVDGTTGVGFMLGSVKVGGDASAGLSFRSGKTWAVTAAQLKMLMERTEGDPSDVSHADLDTLLGAPAEQYREGGGDASAQLGVEGLDDLPTAGAEGRVVLGRRSGRGGTTYFFDLGGDPAGTITDLVPGLRVSGHIGAEWRNGDPDVLTLRATGEDRGRETETVLTLPMGTPADRAAVKHAVLVNPRHSTLAWRDLLSRIEAHGTIQRNRYETTSDDHGWDAELAFGAKVGADHHITSLTRKLVEAQILNGPFPSRRADCLGA